MSRSCFTRALLRCADTDATRFSTLAGTSTPGPDIFLFGKQGTYTQTVVGQTTGRYQDALLGNGVAANITANSDPGSIDQISVLPNNAGVRFGRMKGVATGTSGPVATQLLVRGADGSERAATITTTIPTAGQDTVSFDASHDAVSVTAGKQSGAYSLALTWVDPNGSPQAFTTPKLPIAAGDVATFTPTSWSSLGSQSLALKVTHGNGAVTVTTVKNMVTPQVPFSVALKVAAKKPAGYQLTIDSKFKKLVKGSSALFSWTILHGTRLVGSHTVTVSGAKLRAGLVARKFTYVPGLHAQDRFIGAVTLISPTTDGSYSSQKHMATNLLHG